MCSQAVETDIDAILASLATHEAGRPAQPSAIPSE
jgi:hypothetical protein